MPAFDSCHPQILRALQKDGWHISADQYLVYQSLLQERGIEIPLYLAVPEHAYNGVFKRMALPVLTQNHVRMMIVDLEQEVIQQWLN